MFAIQTSGLTRSFGNRLAVDRLDLEIPQGSIFGFLGPNGAGKTTTIRLLAGLIAPTSGEVAVLGRSVTGQADFVRRSVGLLTETPGLYDRLTPTENLRYFGQLHGLPGRCAALRVEALLRDFGLWEHRGRRCATLSKGLRQKVAIARALLHDPEVLFFDEPTSGLDPEAARTVRELVKSLRARQKTVFLTTHNLGEAEELCDQLGVFNRRLLAVGALDELRRKQPGCTVRITLAQAAATWADVPVLAGFRLTQGVSDGETLVVNVTDPVRDNPVLLRQMVQAGAPVVSVEVLQPSLEELYLRLVRPTDVSPGPVIAA
ncbi:MAG TPA: ABC transporter ATP-binding protein [Chthoniobacterales bacterium]